MTVLSSLSKKGVKLPTPETCDGIGAQAVIDKIRSYMTKAEKGYNDSYLLDGEFLELISTYPESMCSRNLGDNLQLVMALVYEDGQPTPQELIEWEAQKRVIREQHQFDTPTEIEKTIKEHEPQQAFSYEHLAIMFNCSKSTVNFALKRKGVQAKAILEPIHAREQAHEQAVKELVEEEKKKLLDDRQNEGTNSQTSERTDKTL